MVEFGSLVCRKANRTTLCNFGGPRVRAFQFPTFAFTWSRRVTGIKVILEAQYTALPSISGASWREWRSETRFAEKKNFPKKKKKKKK